jgi:hypothetical protein
MKNNKKSNSLIDKDFHYMVEIDYDRDRHCHDYRCNDEGICRCATIHNARVVDVCLDYIIKDITNKNTPLIDLYGIDRILTKLNVKDNDNWEIGICGGYYGEEIDRVTLVNAKEVQKEIDKFLALKSIEEKVEHLLNFEYGYLIEKVKNLSWEEKVIDYSKVSLLEDVMRKANKDIVNEYKEYPYYKCVVIKDGKKFRLIDGYHRFVAVKDGTSKINVLCGYPSTKN